MDGIPRLIWRLWAKLEWRRRRQFRLIILLMLASAVLEVVSLGAVVPFIAVLVDPVKALDYPVVGRLASGLGIDESDNLVLLFTVGFGSVALVSGAVHLLVLRVSTRLSVSAAADLRMEAYRRTLYQPYRIHAERNSSEVMSGVLEKTETATRSVFQPIQTLGTTVLVAVAVIGTLIAISPVVAMVAFAVLGGGYGSVVGLVRRRLRQNSKIDSVERTKLYRALQEGLGGIRDVLLGGLQAEYMDIYRSADRPLRRTRSTNAFITLAPRYLIETLALILVAAMAYWFSRDSGGVAGALPVLGAIAVGGQRLLPALQQGYFAWASIMATESQLRETLEYLEQPIDENLLQPVPDALGLENQICFRNVSFRYSKDEPWVLRGVDFCIPKGSKVAVVGPSGSGKSTLLDILMGLLEPTSGWVEVDGQRLTPDVLRSWQQSLAHVPQHIFLVDASLIDNIALGSTIDGVDEERVTAVVRRSRLTEVVEASSEGLGAQVGERGIRLSGGQRQRLGIARALYKTADLLVLDEATSALDNVIEREIAAEITLGSPGVTVVVVAHRLSTIEDCDTIVELVDGRIASSGTYRELLESSPTFERLANASTADTAHGEDASTEV